MPILKSKKKPTKKEYEAALKLVLAEHAKYIAWADWTVTDQPASKEPEKGRCFNLSGQDLSWARIEDARLRLTSFVGSTIECCDLAMTKIVQSDFERADFRPGNTPPQIGNGQLVRPGAKGTIYLLPKKANG